jgi:hypothetical protein
MVTSPGDIQGFQQQPPLLWSTGVEWGLIVTGGLGAGAGPMRFLISAAIVMNAYGKETTL